jgi:hypothetical protein
MTMNTIATMPRLTTEEARIESSAEGKNPWTNDHVLLSLSVWWVRMTQPNTADFGGDVATVFGDLQRDLQ